MTHGEAAGSDARDVGILGLGEMLFEIGRDKHSGKDTLIVAEPCHGALQHRLVSTLDAGQIGEIMRTYQALATVMAAMSQLPERWSENPMMADEGRRLIDWPKALLPSLHVCCAKNEQVWEEADGHGRP